jgi:hypothetical protein
MKRNGRWRLALEYVEAVMCLGASLVVGGVLVCLTAPVSVPVIVVAMAIKDRRCALENLVLQCTPARLCAQRAVRWPSPAIDSSFKKQTCMRGLLAMATLASSSDPTTFTRKPPTPTPTTVRGTLNLSPAARRPSGWKGSCRRQQLWPSRRQLRWRHNAMLTRRRTTRRWRRSGEVKHLAWDPADQLLPSLPLACCPEHRFPHG